FSSRRRHTRYWRDWSSDVCSSDLWRIENGERRMENARSGPSIRLQFSIFHCQLSIIYSSVKFFQIHAFVQACDLIAVAVEHQSFAPEKLADAPLGGLAPARVIDLGIDVGVKAVLLGLHGVPRGFRLAFD